MPRICGRQLHRQHQASLLLEVSFTIGMPSGNLKRNITGSSCLPSTLSSTLPRISSFYPNIKALVTILRTLSVISCSAERAFSGLKHSKTDLHSSMTNERLTSLSLLHMHADIVIDIEKVIDEFSRRHPRRMTLNFLTVSKFIIVFFLSSIISISSFIYHTQITELMVLKSY